MANGRLERDKELENPIMRPMAKDLEGTKKETRQKYEEAQKQVEKDASGQKWWGKRGNVWSVPDDMVNEHKAQRDRAFHESQMWEQDGAEFPKKYASGGKVRGVGVAQRGFGKGKIC